MLETIAKIDTATDEAAKSHPKNSAAEPQPEIATRENAISTFSLNVSDVSFKLAAASLEFVEKNDGSKLDAVDELIPKDVKGTPQP